MNRKDEDLPVEPAAQPVGEPICPHGNVLGVHCDKCADIDDAQIAKEVEGAMTITLEEAIEELKELAMDEDYRPDSFTFQPLRIALTNAKKAAQPVGEPEPEEHPRADCEGCFRPDCPCNMNEDWLDAELRANGIDPHELNQKMLGKIEQALAEGHDTPRLHEAHAAFKRAVEPKPAPQATPATQQEAKNAAYYTWLGNERASTREDDAFKSGFDYGWNAAQAYYERKIAEAEARAQKAEEELTDTKRALELAVHVNPTIWTRGEMEDKRDELLMVARKERESNAKAEEQL